MKIIFRTNEGVMVASVEGESANSVLPKLMPYVESVQLKDSAKKGFKFKSDMVLPVLSAGNGLRIFMWKGSLAIVEN